MNDSYYLCPHFTLTRRLPNLDTPPSECYQLHFCFRSYRVECGEVSKKRIDQLSAVGTFITSITKRTICVWQFVCLEGGPVFMLSLLHLNYWLYATRNYKERAIPFFQLLFTGYILEQGVETFKQSRNLYRKILAISVILLILEATSVKSTLSLCWNSFFQALPLWLSLALIVTICEKNALLARFIKQDCWGVNKLTG